MPRKPKRPCSRAGCPELTEGRFCMRHQQEENARYNRYGRDPNTRARYGRNWPRIREQQLSEQPLCEMCLRGGTTTPAKEVHHIVPLIEGGTHAKENLMSLCKRCHSRFTLEEIRARRSR